MEFPDERTGTWIVRPPPPAPDLKLPDKKEETSADPSGWYWPALKVSQQR